MKIVAVTSCITGIAHTYMAAEALERAAKKAGHEIHVETQGAAGSSPLKPALIAEADLAIFAVDLEVKDRSRFAGKPYIELSVSKALADAEGTVARAVAACQDGSAPIVAGSAPAPAPVRTEANAETARKSGFLDRLLGRD